jgi:hypothetical protein
MATLTLGTNLTTSLTAIAFSQAVSDADFATIINGIIADKGPAASPVNSGNTPPGAFSRNGLLFIPNRGVLKVLAGDFVAIDSAGPPVLVSANSAANANWTHS